MTKFLKNFNSNSMILDIGCGNSKNIVGNPHLNFKGIDFSEKLVSFGKITKLFFPKVRLLNKIALQFYLARFNLSIKKFRCIVSIYDIYPI